MAAGNIAIDISLYQNRYSRGEVLSSASIPVDEMRAYNISILGEEAIKQKMEAEEIARKLFLSLLNKDQKEEYNQRKGVTVVGSLGNKYYLHTDLVTFNVHREGIAFCALPRWLKDGMFDVRLFHVPVFDNYVVQLMMLQTNEELFLSKANKRRESFCDTCWDKSANNGAFTVVSPDVVPNREMLEHVLGSRDDFCRNMRWSIDDCMRTITYTYTNPNGFSLSIEVSMGAMLMSDYGSNLRAFFGRIYDAIIYRTPLPIPVRIERAPQRL